jgi:hypothetical protein
LPIFASEWEYLKTKVKLDEWVVFKVDNSDRPALFKRCFYDLNQFNNVANLEHIYQQAVTVNLTDLEKQHLEDVSEQFERRVLQEKRTKLAVIAGKIDYVYKHDDKKDRDKMQIIAYILTKNEKLVPVIFMKDLAYRFKNKVSRGKLVSILTESTFSKTARKNYYVAVDLRTIVL